MMAFLLLCGTSLGISFGESEKPQIWVSNPWIAYITSFVGGEEIVVHPLSDWEGYSLCTEHFSLPSGGVIIVLDHKEAENIPIAYELQNVRYLFDHIPSLWGKANPMYLDPPTMSLLGQKVLITLSSLFPEHYVYFQRNLAEFESRIESTVDMGRKMLQSVKVVNLSGVYAFWIKAAAFQEIRPSREKMSLLIKTEEEEGGSLLIQTLETALLKGHLVITDQSMPIEFQEMIEQEKNGLVLSYPPLSEPRRDFFLFLYEQYLTIVNRYNQFHGETRKTDF